LRLLRESLEDALALDGRLPRTLGPAVVAAQDGYHPMIPVEGTRTFDIGAIEATVLIEEASLGGAELEMVRMTFPPGGPSTGGQHRHGRVEVFYVLSGAHRVLSEEPVQTLVIWAPGGGLSRIEGRGGSEPATHARLRRTYRGR
jgi:hypothetical protein